jgi:hypothetical protein
MSLSNMRRILAAPRVAGSLRSSVMATARPLSGAAGVSIGEFDTVIAEIRGKVGLITLNRPKVNAASDGLLQDVIAACKAFDKDSSVGAVVITGNEKVGVIAWRLPPRVSFCVR